MSSHVITPNIEAAILARIIQSQGREIIPEVASYLLSMKLSATDEERVNDLLAKARGFRCIASKSLRGLSLS